MSMVDTTSSRMDLAQKVLERRGFSCERSNLPLCKHHPNTNSVAVESSSMVVCTLSKWRGTAVSRVDYLIILVGLPHGAVLTKQQIEKDLEALQNDPHLTTTLRKDQLYCKRYYWLQPQGYFRVRYILPIYYAEAIDDQAMDFLLESKEQFPRQGLDFFRTSTHVAAHVASTDEAYYSWKTHLQRFGRFLRQPRYTESCWWAEKLAGPIAMAAPGGGDDVNFSSATAEDIDWPFTSQARANLLQNIVSYCLILHFVFAVPFLNILIGIAAFLFFLVFCYLVTVIQQLRKPGEWRHSDASMDPTVVAGSIDNQGGAERIGFPAAKSPLLAQPEPMTFRIC